MVSQAKVFGQDIYGKQRQKASRWENVEARSRIVQKSLQGRYFTLDLKSVSIRSKVIVLLQYNSTIMYQKSTLIVQLNFNVLVSTINITH